MATSELRGTLRIDAAPGAKRFQGVWLEHADGTRWVIDYRARDLWTWFADHDVIVTGGTYAPQGQAINAIHFRIDSLRFARPDYGRGPYLSMGPEQLLAGAFVTETALPGSKLAGSSWGAFVDEAGKHYVVVGEEIDPRRGAGPVSVRARVLEPDMSYTARTSGPDLWVVAIEDETD